MYRIRFHGRGGQGIKTASQILGSAFFREGYVVQDAPRYGAERRGAPIFAYVRAAKHEIHERGVITHPDLVLVTDDTLVPVPAAGVLQGASEKTVFVIASTESASTWQDRVKLTGPVLTLPLGSDPAHVGVRCAGAAARLLEVIHRENLAAALHTEMASFSAEVIGQNLAQTLAAFDAMAAHAGLVKEGRDVEAGDYTPPEWIDVPFDKAVVAAPDIHAAATSELANTGVWRTYRPVIDYDRCNRCSWVCSTLCPDSAINVDADHTPRIDYDHCKGCLVCVAVCPPHAIRAVPERAANSVEET
jgi:pyruvate ferredoxin oxidoreductase gamma subunit